MPRKTLAYKSSAYKLVFSVEFFPARFTSYIGALYLLNINDWIEASSFHLSSLFGMRTMNQTGCYHWAPDDKNQAELSHYSTPFFSDVVDGRSGFTVNLCSNKKLKKKIKISMLLCNPQALIISKYILSIHMHIHSAYSFKHFL